MTKAEESNVKQCPYPIAFWFRGTKNKILYVCHAHCVTLSLEAAKRGIPVVFYDLDYTPHPLPLPHQCFVRILEDPKEEIDNVS